MEFVGSVSATTDSAYMGPMARPFTGAGVNVPFIADLTLPRGGDPTAGSGAAKKGFLGSTGVAAMGGSPANHAEFDVLVLGRIVVAVLSEKGIIIVITFRWGVRTAASEVRKTG